MNIYCYDDFPNNSFLSGFIWFCPLISWKQREESQWLAGNVHRDQLTEGNKGPGWDGARLLPTRILCLLCSFLITFPSSSIFLLLSLSFEPSISESFLARIVTRQHLLKGDSWMRRLSLLFSKPVRKDFPSNCDHNCIKEGGWCPAYLKL